MLNLPTLLIMAALPLSISALPEQMPDPSVIPDNDKLQLKVKFWNTTDCDGKPKTQLDLLQEKEQPFYIDDKDHTKGLHEIRSFKISRDMLKDEVLCFFEGPPGGDPCSLDVNVMWAPTKEGSTNNTDHSCYRVTTDPIPNSPFRQPDHAQCVQGARWVYTSTTESSMAATPTAH